MRCVPADVLDMFTLFGTIKERKCHNIRPPHEVECVHMYSVAWDALVFCSNHYLTAFLIMDLLAITLSRNDCPACVGVRVRRWAWVRVGACEFLLGVLSLWSHLPLHLPLSIK